MNAGFFRRAFSSIIDLTLVLLVVFGSYFAFGRSVLRNQVADFEILYPNYQELMSSYNADVALVELEYKANLELAGEEQTAIDAAASLYQTKLAVLDQQNVIDLEPFNMPLSPYFLSIVYFVLVASLILMSIYTVAVVGKTLGRKAMQLKLDGPTNRISIFFHDIMFKYFIIILVIILSNLLGLALAALALVADVILIGLTRNKRTLRDSMTKLSVIKVGYGS
jgi:hypothetical protein